MNRKITFLSSFWLKILAFLFMTIDHIGWLLEDSVGSNYWPVLPCRIIGRLALPLFCFMIAEGVIHTKNFGKYAARLGVMALIVTGTLIFVEYSTLFPDVHIRNEGNIFIDLLCGASVVYFLKRKEVGLKFIALVPFIVSILSFVANCMETSGTTTIHWFPFFLRMQYDWYGVLLCAGFYFAYTLKDWALDYHEKLTGLNKEYLEGSFLERNLSNIFAIGMLIIITMMYFLSSYVIGEGYTYWRPGLQNYALFSGAFILLYNGKRGYNAKWFEYGSYLYYPIHLLLIFGIGMLVL